MTKLDGLYEDVATGRGGYFTAGQARALGISRQVVAHHLSAGSLRGAAHGVYRFKWFPSWPREDVMVAWLGARRDTAAVSHESALEHGGIGFTWEHDLHFFMKRGAADARLFGSVGEHRDRVAGAFGLGGDGVDEDRPAPELAAV